MTKEDYDNLTKMEKSDPSGPGIGGPTPIHDLSDANTQAVKDAHGVKVIKGKDWKRMSPKERDKHIREVMDKMSGMIVVKVPSGNVWVIPIEDFNKLLRDQDVRIWATPEVEKLPKSVRTDPMDRDNHRGGNEPFNGSIRVEFRL